MRFLVQLHGVPYLYRPAAAGARDLRAYPRPDAGDPYVAAEDRRLAGAGGQLGVDEVDVAGTREGLDFGEVMALSPSEIVAGILVVSTVPPLVTVVGAPGLLWSAPGASLYL